MDGEGRAGLCGGSAAVGGVGSALRRASAALAGGGRTTGLGAGLAPPRLPAGDSAPSAPPARPAAAGRSGNAAPGAAGRSGNAAPAAAGHPIRRPKRTLGALALGLCAIGVAVGSGADFYAETANPSNTFSSGSLKMDNSRDGAAILNATNMKPGGPPETGTVDIKNTGTINGTFKLTRDQLTNSDTTPANPSPFANKVLVWVVDCGAFTTSSTPYGTETNPPVCGDADDNTLYNGTLANQNAPIALGTYHPGDQHRYWFGALLDGTAGPEYEGDGASARYVFGANQAQ